MQTGRAGYLPRIGPLDVDTVVGEACRERLERPDGRDAQSWMRLGGGNEIVGDAYVQLLRTGAEPGAAACREEGRLA